MSGLSKLVEIDRAELPQLRDMYLTDWPENMLGYYTVDNFIRCFEKDPEIKSLVFYCLDGDWSDGSFAVIDRYQLYLNSLSDSNDTLIRILRKLDWSRGFKVCTFRRKHRPVVDETITKKNLSLEIEGENLLYYMPKEDAAKLTVNLPNGMTLGSLRRSHAFIADSVWPNRHIGSIFFLDKMAKSNVNIGLFSQQGNLVAWFRYQTGMFGAIQIVGEQIGKGYALVVCRAITKKLGELGEDVFACVGETNVESNKMFTSAGFKVIDRAYWLKTRPTKAWVDDENVV